MRAPIAGEALRNRKPDAAGARGDENALALYPSRQVDARLSHSSRRGAGVGQIAECCLERPEVAFVAAPAADRRSVDRLAHLQPALRLDRLGGFLRRKACCVPGKADKLDELANSSSGAAISFS